MALLVAGHFRESRYRQRFRGCRFSQGKIVWLEIKIPKAFLQVQRHWIINTISDAIRSQVVL